MKQWDDIKAETNLIKKDAAYQDLVARRRLLEVEVEEFEQSPPSRSRLDTLRIQQERVAVAIELQEASKEDLAAIDEAIEAATAEYTSSLDEHSETVRLKRRALQVLRDRERDALAVSKRRHAEETRTAMADAWQEFDSRLGTMFASLEEVMALHKMAVENGLCENDHDYGRHGHPPHLYINFRHYLDRLKLSGLLERSATLQGDDSPQDIREFQAQR